jgi:Tetratricopeptide repeat
MRPLRSRQQLEPVRIQAADSGQVNRAERRKPTAQQVGERLIEHGEHRDARDRFAELVLIYERVLGPEHPDTLTVRSNIARWTGEAGDAAAAGDLFAGLLPVRQRVSGPEHSYVLIIHGNIARWTAEAGDPARAQELYAELLPIYERAMGAEHPDTLGIRSNLARWTTRLSRLAKQLQGPRLLGCRASVSAG